MFGSDNNPLVAFDVVNEVVSDSGEFADGLRRSERYRILGENFIDLAFQYANEAFNDTYAVAGPRPGHPVHQRLQHRAGRQAGRYKALVSDCSPVACRSAAWVTSSTCTVHTVEHPRWGAHRLRRTCP